MAEKKINGREFRHAPMLAEDALDLQFRLLQFLGVSAEDLPEVLKGAGKKRDDETAADHAKRETASNAAMVKFISSIFKENDVKTFMGLVRDLLEKGNLQIKGENGDWIEFSINGSLSGRLGDLIPLVSFVLLEEFGDFFGGIPNAKKLGVAALANR